MGTPGYAWCGGRIDQPKCKAGCCTGSFYLLIYTATWLYLAWTQFSFGKKRHIYIQQFLYIRAYTYSSCLHGLFDFIPRQKFGNKHDLSRRRSQLPY
ncbi:hypothetical protein BX666DRAFT_1916046 [Dichotomocladium elegans]|nr:hypothetical protein BX666DRAFT_1916046 [Dichotomocladium elegans]